MSSTNDAMEARRKREMPSIKTLPGGSGVPWASERTPKFQNLSCQTSATHPSRLVWAIAQTVSRNSLHGDSGMAAPSVGATAKPLRTRSHAADKHGLSASTALKDSKHFSLLSGGHGFMPDVPRLLHPSTLFRSIKRKWIWSWTRRPASLSRGRALLTACESSAGWPRRGRRSRRRLRHPR
jgi:hypothetical protein